MYQLTLSLIFKETTCLHQLLYSFPFLNSWITALFFIEPSGREEGFLHESHNQHVQGTSDGRGVHTDGTEFWRSLETCHFLPTSQTSQ